MTEYSLNLISSFTPWRTYSSCEFIGNELRKRFEKLPHVRLHCQSMLESDFPETDFALFHAYFSTPAYAELNKLKTKSRLITSFMEEQHPDVDYCWHYSDPAFGHVYRGQLLFAPIVRSLLPNLPKEPNSILLDHDVVEFSIYRKEYMDWNEDIWKWLEPLKDSHTIYQLQRHPRDATPDYIHKIPLGTPEDYLAATARMETFIVTHNSSYNHTAVEMIARGSRTLVPRNPWCPLLPNILVNMFRLPQFRDGEELLQELAKPVDRQEWDEQINKCIDMDAVVACMDHTFQTWKDILLAKVGGWDIPVCRQWIIEEDHREREKDSLASEAEEATRQENPPEAALPHDPAAPPAGDGPSLNDDKDSQRLRRTFP